MFTGLVREVGTVASFEDGRLRVESSIAAAVGDSVAIDGVCLTVVDGDRKTLAFDAVPETLARTTLGRLGRATPVNLEPALRAGEPLGGHYVQGHVDGVGRIRSVETEGDGQRVWIDAPPRLLRYCVEKGSIAVDGVSLTVADSRRRGLRGRTRAAHARGDHTRRSRAPATRSTSRPTSSPSTWRGSRGYDLTMATAAERRTFASIEDAIEDVRNGKFVVVVDDPNRENEGDLVIAAQFATPEAINFMATHARGLICLCLTEERCDELGLRQMTEHNEAPLGTAFTVSVEAREGVTTGISAADRSRTIQVAIDPKSTPHDLVTPGHVFPLRARDGGVLRRAGQTEASVDLARLAGLYPAGVVCEIMNEDGTMARVPDLVTYCARHEAEAGQRRRPGRVPAPPREAGHARDRGPAADGVRRVPGDRLPREADRQAPRRARARRRRRRGRRARPRPLGVPDRRRLPLAPLRLRRPARHRAAAHHRRDRGVLLYMAQEGAASAC